MQGIEQPFTPEDLEFFEENGYVVLHNAVPQENLTATVDAIWEHLGIDRKDRKDWYRKPATQIGFVELYHHQAFWNNRQHPRIYGAYCQLWKTEKLWVSIDRASLKFPSTEGWNHQGFLHWDYNIWDENTPFGLQGVLCLEDTGDDQGGFHCVPGIHKWYKEIPKQVQIGSTVLDKWNTLGFPINVPEEAKNKFPMKSKVIPAKAGDLIIWRREIAHGVGRNTSDSPRLAQYIAMFPSRYNHPTAVSVQECLERETTWDRINMWKNCENPKGKPGDDRRIEQQKKQAAELTPLGMKLLGLEDY